MEINITNIHKAQKLINRCLVKSRLLILAESALLSLAFAAFLLSFFQLFVPVFEHGYFLPAVFVWVLIFILISFVKGLFHFNKKKLLTYLDRKYPQLEESASLIFLEESPSTLAKLQQIKVSNRLIENQKAIKLPHQLRLVFIASLALSLSAASVFSIERSGFLNDNQQQVLTKNAVVQSDSVATKFAKLESFKLRIHPPSYTALPLVTQNKGEIQTVQNSFAKWSVTFSDTVNHACLIFNEKDTLSLQQNLKSYSFRKKLSYPGFYRLAWRTDSLTESSPLYAIQLTKDQPPLIEFKEAKPYQKIKWEEAGRLNLSVQLKDDFGISEAYLLATVSRGSGESVKFREERLSFSEEFSKKKKNYHLNKELIFKDLKMEPGDELYYRVIAFDNKKPQAQQSRSDTYILVLEDTSAQEVAVAQGVAVDMMPEYFRSQRQIIIDTEKLIVRLKNGESIGQRSNELAADQKILRLRYGQFLGEEYESSMGSSTQVMAELMEEDHEDHEGHQTHEEHGEDDKHTDKKELQASVSSHDHAGHTENHEQESERFGTIGSSIESFYHKHDPEGVSTYFDEEIKATLKAALAQMWEAELHLRLAHPSEALPYEYQALELIKKVQQKSRIYVERLGFEPPPLKPAEKRLSGELKAIESRKDVRYQNEESPFDGIRRGLKVLESINGALTKQQKSQLQAAGNELSAVALQRAGRYLKALEVLRELMGKGVADSQQLNIIRQAFLDVLPEQSPEVRKSSRGRLQELYLEQLNR